VPGKRSLAEGKKGKVITKGGRGEQLCQKGGCRIFEEGDLIKRGHVKKYARRGIYYSLVEKIEGFLGKKERIDLAERKSLKETFANGGGLKPFTLRGENRKQYLGLKRMMFFQEGGGVLGWKKKGGHGGEKNLGAWRKRKEAKQHNEY